MHFSETRVTDTFLAKGPDGQSHQVNEMTEFIETTPLSSAHKEWTPGLRRFELDNGDAVNMLSPTRFRVVRTGVRLTKMG